MPGAGRSVHAAAVIATSRTLSALRRPMEAQIRQRVDRPKAFSVRAFFVSPMTFDGQAPVISPTARSVGLNRPPAGQLRFKDLDFLARRRHYLDIIERGGPRPPKGMEVALRLRGLLEPGEFVVPSSDAFLDRHGNVPAAVVKKILADLRLFHDQAAWSTPASRARRRARSYGRGMFQGGQRFFFAPGNRGLPRGIYEAANRPGAMPLMWFVVVKRAPQYRKQLRLRADAKRYAMRLFPAHFHRAFREQMARRLNPRGVGFAA